MDGCFVFPHTDFRRNAGSRGYCYRRLPAAQSAAAFGNKRTISREAIATYKMSITADLIKKKNGLVTNRCSACAPKDENKISDIQSFT